MKNTRIHRNFARLTDASISTLASRIVSLLTANVAFPDPHPSLATFSEALEEYDYALNAAAIGAPWQKSHKNNCRKVLTELLNDLADYVEYTAKGDRASLLTTGFDVSSDTTSKIELRKLEELKVRNTANAGDVEVHLQVEGARSVLFQYTPDPLTAQSAWQSESSSRKKIVIKNLTRYEKYWFRAIATGSHQQKLVSRPVMTVIL